jgi:hypothetical protein
VTPTQVMTLGLLAVAWLAIAFPLAMRTRSQSVSGSVTGFTQAMSVLDPELKASTVSAATNSPRRAGASSHLQLLRRLLALAVGSSLVFSVAAFAWGGVFVPLAVVSMVGTVGYVGLLRRRKVEQDRARAVITSIRDQAGLPARPREARPRSAREREVLPRVVGQGPDLPSDDRAGWDEPAGWDDQRQRFATRSSSPRLQPLGAAPSRFASDVRVLTDHERIRAHHGFDVLH